MSAWLGLAGTRVLVVGAGGIGAALTRGFADAGSVVALADREPERLTAAGQVAATTIELDATSSESCAAAVRRASDALGGLDVLVHAVGINRRVPLTDVSDEAWDAIVTTNLSSAFWLVRAAVPAFRAQGSGRIIFFSSVAGLLGHRDHGPYAASKGGMNQLARALAHEVAADGITVNLVAPGYTETDLTRDYLERDGNRERLTSLVPAGRLGTTDELVGPTLFLASRHASFITGHVLYVDGGRTLL